ncbi:hypothetical protein SJ05684_c10660 [Sinorhizobium sojae CCBAU 05684]|uniref:Uncharacterized protein n=1 Tax=Sinorhizobium sojae CCBAU 05684 TaxID=716928 RepID=A0A249P9B1_9HYPH|nr:hypothetical protein [Sinorhizobium sojae]ASY62523.1 hypothetical protein SJ05684_c10660 [Sinorhizobium sojae CCBAU 05684]
MDRVIWCDKGWQPMYFGFCPSEKAWKKEVKRLGHIDAEYPTNAGTCTVFHETKGWGECILVTIADGAESERNMLEIVGLLVHEATHVWQYILKHMGEKSPSAEFEAYSMQAISMALVQAFDKTRGLPK